MIEVIGEKVDKNTMIKIKKFFGVLILIIAIPLLLYAIWLIVGSTIYAIKEGQDSGSGMGQMFGIISFLFFCGLTYVGYYLLTGKDIK